MQRARVNALSGACAAAALAFAAATVALAEEERFVVPAELAPSDLNGAFPVALTTSAGTLTGTIDLVVTANGSLTGSALLDGDALSVAGTQRLTSKGGKVVLTLTAPDGQLSLSGSLANGAVAGSAKGKGRFAGARRFVLDAALAPPLVAMLDFVATTDARGHATVAGDAKLAGASIPLTGGGTLTASSCALSAKGAGLSWSAKGAAVYGGGFLAGTKTAGFGAHGAETRRIAPVRVDLSAGVVHAPSQFPAAAPVTYSDGGTPVTVDAHPGQVLVFADPGTSVAAASSLVTPLGGTVVAAVPAAGEFLVAVAPGSESAFITAVGGSVLLALPHVEVVRGGANATILDGCGIDHGKDVGASFREAGGVGATCRNDSDGAGVPIVQQTLENLYGAIADAGGGPVLVNISSSGRTDATWTGMMRAYLAAIAAVPESQRDQLVVTICLGNEGRDRTALLDGLRNDPDPRLARALRDNILLVGAKAPDGSSYSNRAVGPEVAYMERDFAPRDPNTRGTSFAAPRALAAIQRLVRTKGLSPREALEAVKLAAQDDANRMLTQAGADAAAAEVKLRRAVIGVPAGGLTFTMVEGGPAPAPQTLAISNVGAPGSTLRCTVTTFAPSLALGEDPRPLRTGETALVEVAVDVSGILFAGTVRAELVLDDPKVKKRRVRVPVTIVVQPAPAGSVSITSAAIAFTGDGPFYHSYRLTVSGTVSGPLTAGCDVRVNDTNFVRDSPLLTLPEWGDDTSRDSGEPKTSSFTFTKNYHTNVALPRAAFSLTVTARVIYFADGELKEIEAATDVQGL